ncbi:FAD-dependent oxidoreductase [Nannocystis pusilla]|uniref:FAD-dependent oxidoreductase n=1 Tax=Nannocystis pusilla TaxID=889268 RepID=UPI003B81736F
MPTRESDAERDYWRRCDKPAARFFVAMNPSYGQGNGIVTMFPISASMLTGIASRIVRERAARLVEGTLAAAQRLPLVDRLLRPRAVRRQLQAAPLLAGLADTDLQRLAERARIVALPAGHTLFHAGDAGDEVYVVARGAVAVVAGEEMLDQLGAGALFGEIAVLTGGRRKASVRAVIPTTLVKIPGEAVRAVMRRGPLGDALAEVAAARLFDDHLRASGRHHQLGREARMAWARGGRLASLEPGRGCGRRRGVLDRAARRRADRAGRGAAVGAGAGGGRVDAVDRDGGDDARAGAARAGAGRGGGGVVMRDRYDAIVIGAGPSGTTCARELAARGASVLLIDKKSPGWHKPCGGGIPEVLFEPYGVPAELGFSAPKVRVFDAAQRLLTIPLRYRTVYRDRFDEHLAAAARAAGAEGLFDTMLLDVTRDEGGFIVRTSKGSTRSTYLVGADGCMSTVRRKLFPEQLPESMCAIAVEHWYRAPHGVTSLDFFVEPDVLGTGYAYVFPKDPGLLVIGVAGLGLDRPRAVLEQLLTRPRYRALVGDVPVDAVHGARIPYRHLSRLRDGRLLLVGDAAGSIRRSSSPASRSRCTRGGSPARRSARRCGSATTRLWSATPWPTCGRRVSGSSCATPFTTRCSSAAGRPRSRRWPARCGGARSCCRARS